MSAEVYAGLGALAVAVLAALTTYVQRIGRELTENTALTRIVQQNANGTLTDALERLAAERNTVVGLRALLRERDDRLAYIVVRHPEVQATLSEYIRLREARWTDAQEAAAVRRVAPVSDDPAIPQG